jgi:hypothetical protein
MSVLLNLVLVHTQTVPDQLADLPCLFASTVVLFLQIQAFAKRRDQQTVSNLHNKELRVIDIENADLDLNVTVYIYVSLDAEQRG